MSEFGVVVAATEKALRVFADGAEIDVEFVDWQTTGEQRVTLDGWVRISPVDEGWGLYVGEEGGEFVLIDSDADPLEIVKSAIVEVISGRTRDLLSEVLDGDS